MVRTSYTSKWYRYDIPFVPSSDGRIKTMLKLAGVKNGEKAIDLGAGDGKVVVELAKKGARVVGLEIDEGRCRRAREKIMIEGLDKNAQVYWMNFWDTILTDFDLITVYGISSVMKKLGKKIKKEAKKGCRIVSNGFTFPDWKPQESKNDVYLYVK